MAGTRLATLTLLWLGAWGCDKRPMDPSATTPDLSMPADMAMAPPPDLFVRPPGSHLWSRRHGGAMTDIVYGLTADTAGNVVAAGYFYGTTDPGGGPLTSAGDSDIVVTKYDPAGTHLWSKRFGGATNDYARSPAVDKEGNVIVTGVFQGGADFGVGVLTSAGAHDVFVLKLSPAGAPVWATRIGGTDSEESYSVAVDKDDNVVVALRFGGMVTFGGMTYTSAGGQDILLTKLSSAGAPLWVRRYGGTGAETPRGVTVDAGGNVFLVGATTGTVDFGGGPLTTAGGDDGFVAKMGPDGSHQWSRRFGGTGTDVSAWAAVDSGGGVVIAGSFTGTVDFGGGPLASAGGLDAFLVKWTAAGAHVWSRRYGGADDDRGSSVTVDGNDAVVLAGAYLSAAVDFGVAQLTQAGNSDGYVAKHNAAGAPVWVKRLGAGEKDQAFSVATDGAGSVAVGGGFGGAVDFGGGQLTSVGADDAFVVKLAP